MKHNLTIVNGKAKTISESFGLDANLGQAGIILIVEFIKAGLLKSDNRTKSECLVDILDILTPEQLGFAVDSPAGYLSLGLICAQAIETAESMMDVLASKRTTISEDHGAWPLSDLLKAMDSIKDEDSQTDGNKSH